VINSMELKKPRGIIFDFGDTLMQEESVNILDGYERLLEFVVNPNSITAQEVTDFTNEMEKDLRQKKDQSGLEISLPNFFRLAFDRLGLAFHLSYEQMEREFWEAAVVHHPSPGISGFLDFLDTQGIIKAVLSNASVCRETLTKDLSKYHLDRYFAFVMSSAEYGIRKPNPMLFEAAIKKMGIFPHEIWFAGDRLDNDIIGARNSGLFPIWYNYRNLTNDTGCHYLEIRNWQDLQQIIQNL
jgi:putative hydrolase of the HAD superfamily